MNFTGPSRADIFWAMKTILIFLSLFSSNSAQAVVFSEDIVEVSIAREKIGRCDLPRVTRGEPELLGHRLHLPELRRLVRNGTLWSGEIFQSTQECEEHVSELRKVVELNGPIRALARVSTVLIPGDNSNRQRRGNKVTLVLSGMRYSALEYEKL